ncbi:MAG: GtrA family protein [Acidimicrobiales bacterium]
MIRSLADALDWASTPTGRKAVRYSAASVVSVIVSEIVLFVTYGPLRIGSAVECNVIATAVATIPSYYLNRNWTWGRTGSSHLWRELVPFWVVAFVGLAFSLWAVNLAEHMCKRASLSHLTTTGVVSLAALSAYGLLWVGKFMLFNHLLFADRASGGPSRDGAGAGRL